MQTQPTIQTATIAHVDTADHSILGVFAGTGLSLFGFLILIVLLA